MTNEIKYSDGIGSRGRQHKLLVGLGDAIHEFTGQSIPGVVAIVKSDFTKSGKWSRTDYILRFAPGAWHYTATQSWGEGEYFHDCKSIGDAVEILRQVGCTAPAEAFLLEKFPKTMERLRQAEQLLKSVS